MVNYKQKHNLNFEKLQDELAIDYPFFSFELSEDLCWLTCYIAYLTKNGDYIGMGLLQIIHWQGYIDVRYEKNFDDFAFVNFRCNSLKDIHNALDYFINRFNLYDLHKIIDDNFIPVRQKTNSYIQQLSLF